MKKSKYLILLVDREKARMFMMVDGVVGEKKDIRGGYVHQRVRANERDFYGRSDKIFRHIEVQLHRHLQKIAQGAALFATKQHISDIVIGGHKEVFEKMINHLPYPLNKHVRGVFVTGLKSPFNEITKRARDTIMSIEKGASHGKNHAV